MDRGANYCRTGKDLLGFTLITHVNVWINFTASVITVPASQRYRQMNLRAVIHE